MPRRRSQPIAKPPDAGGERLYRVLHHTGVPEPHYDLLVEVSANGRIPTWRFPTWPIDGPTEVTRLDDHRRLYLQYSGPVSGNRGEVETAEVGLQRATRTRGRWRVLFRHRQTLMGVELTQVAGRQWEAQPLAYDNAP